MISFTSTLKSDLAKIENSEVEKRALLSAVLRNSSEIEDEIKATTENASLARLIYNLIKDIYGIIPSVTVRRGYNFKKNYIYILQINKKKDLILSDLSIYDDVYLDIPMTYLIDDDDSKRAYLRGVFLACGSINDPKKSRYHLEFLVNSLKYASFISNLLNEYELNSKVIQRETKYMIYIKEAEKIGDFLRLIKAYSAVMYYEDIRIYRDHKNMTNRLNNCEQANVDKIIETANDQAKDIELIIENGGLDLLDEKEQIVAKYRLKYRETSLLELSEIISLETEKKITKSGLYHRFKKIKDLSDRIRR